MALSLRRKLTIALLLLYWPMIFVLSHIPIPQLVRRAQVSDKSLHFLIFLILSFLLWFAIGPDRRVNWRKAAVWWTLLAMAGYGAIDEWLQCYVAGRSGTIMDFSSDIAGAAVGLVLFSLLTFRPALLAVTAIAIFLLTNVARVNVAELLPITDRLFHLVAYAFFTLLWVRHIHLLPTKMLQAKRLSAALAVPMTLLLAVKSFSVIIGREIEVRDVIISVAAIAAVVAIYCAISLLRCKSVD